MTQGYSHYDRQLRNDLLVISSLVAESCPDAPFVETGFVKQLTLFATFQEGMLIGVLSRNTHNKGNQDHSMQAMKCLWYSLKIEHALIQI